MPFWWTWCSAERIGTATAIAVQRRERPALAHARLERAAAQQLHDETERAVRVVDEVEDADDVAMRDGRGEPRLATESLVVRRRALAALERLDGDLGLRRLVARDPDVAHAAAADAMDQPDLPAE